MLCTQCLILGISGSVYFFSLPRLHWMYSLGALLITGSTSGSLAKTACSDPGIFPRFPEPPDEEWRYCSHTDSYRPPGVVFCHESQV